MPPHAHPGTASRLQPASGQDHLPAPAHSHYPSVTTRSSRSANNIPSSAAGGVDAYHHQDPFPLHHPFPAGHSFAPENQSDYSLTYTNDPHYDPYPQDPQSPPPPTAPTRNRLSDILHQHQPDHQSSSQFAQQPIDSQHSNEASSRPCSPNTFFASHRAHRSFKSAVEKLNDQSELDSSATAVTRNGTDWSRWNLSPDEPAVNAINPQLINGQSSTSHRPPYNQHPPRSEPHEMSAPYITRSQVHRLAEARQESTLNIPASSAFQHPSQSTSRATTQAKTRANHHSQESSSLFPADQTLNGKHIYSNDNPPCPVRNNDGLPSNSHHLLNSPENKSYRVPANTNHNNNSRTENSQQGAKSAGPHRGGSGEMRPSSLPSMRSQEGGQRSGSTIRRLVGTPTKSQKFNREFESQESVESSSDNAASLLLALSRSEERTHGMALRRGRGSTAPRIETTQLEQMKTPSEKPAGPPTPNGRRYRTRSQIHDELQHESQQRYDLPPIQAPPLQTAAPPAMYSTRARCGQSHDHQHLGHGLPSMIGTDHGGPHLSVSGSTAASTCTNSSEMHGLGSTEPQPFLLHSLHGRARTRVSDCSTTTTTTAMAGVMTDDDARSCFSISTQATSLASPAAFHARRTFPPSVPIDSHFPRLYRAFHVSSAFGARDPIRAKAQSSGITLPPEPTCSGSGGAGGSVVYNTPAHGVLDLYTPRFVKGVGTEKVGLCCICFESKERGGEDLSLWLKMKVSSYSYHLGFFHGINNSDGLPFSPPVEIRISKRGLVAANEKNELKEGKCHQCNKWIAMEGVKLQEVKVPELFWWKHAKSCHKSRIEGECHVHVEDEIHDLLMGHQHRSYPPLSSSSTGSTFQQQHLSPAAPHSGGSSSTTTRVHPSVAAQRASAGRVYKRKASVCSLNGNTKQALFSPQQCDGGGSSSSSSVGYTSNLGMLYHHQLPQSPTPQQGSFSPSSFNHHQLSDHLTTTNSTTMTAVVNLPPLQQQQQQQPRKTRRSNAWKSGGTENGQS